MADENESLEEETELDEAEDEDAPEGEPEGEDAEDDEPEGEPDDGEAPANKWQALQQRLNSSLKPSAGSGQDDSSEDDDDEEDDQDEDEEEGESDAPAGKKPAETQAEGKKAGQPEEEPKARRYSITDAEGNRFEFDLDDGVKIQFKADGRDVEVRSMDELVQMAQKGGAFDRVSSENAKFKSKLGGLEKELEQANDLLIQICTDPAAFKRVRGAVKGFADPEFRKAKEAEYREARRTEEERERAAEARQEAVTEFWRHVEGVFHAQLEEYPFLDRSDYQDVAASFYAPYEAEFRTLVKRYGEDPASIERAQQEAAALLGEEQLKAAMKALNSRYAGRFAAPRKQGSAKSEREGKRQAEAHNARVKKKLEQRESTRALRSGSSVPRAGSSGSRRARAEPKTFDGKLKKAFGRFHQLTDGD